MNWFVFLFLSFIFILSPYQRGLYFDKDFYGIQVLIFALFVMLFITLVIKKEIHTLKPIWLACLLPFMFLLPLFVAENQQGAWDSVLRWMSYTGFFFLLYWSSLHDRHIKTLLPIVFQFTGIWIVGHMLANELGWMEFPHAFIFDRFAGVFQYPNTFGMVMIVFYVFSLMMVLKEKSSYLLLSMYSFPLILFLVGFFESYSRGMYLVFPLAWFVGLFMLKPSLQMKYVTYTILSMIGSLFMLFFIQDAESLPIAATLVFLSILLTGLILFIEKGKLGRKLTTTIEQLNQKKHYHLLAPIIIVFLAVLLLLDFGFEGKVYQTLPESMQDRLSSISESTTARERIVMMEDAIEMSKDSPFIGFGGNAWESLYKKYQQLPYQANKVHNEYLEFVIDIGWIGLLVFIAVFGLLYYRVMKNYVANSDNTIYIAVLTASLVIFIHSFIDFNLSYGTIWFFLFWLLVMGLTPDVKSRKTKQKLPTKNGVYTYGLYAFFVMLLVSVFFSYQFMKAEQFYQKAMHSENLQAKEHFLEKTMEKAPYRDTYSFALGDVYIQLAEHHQQSAYHPKVVEISTYLAQMEPNNSLVLYKSGVMLESIGETEKAIARYQAAIAVDSFDANMVETAITAMVDFAENNITYAEQAIELYKEQKSVYQDFQDNPIGAAHNSRGFEITEQTKQKISEAYEMLSHN
ncbi:O-antigen ligase family protein [Oceanobacillus halophilus]|nr:O-antigen ligase family protein [Oceanobacillus halophilus]